MDRVLRCLNENGKNDLSLCAQQFNDLQNCYHLVYSNAEFAMKMYNSQRDFILNGL